jgi:hypothetical protein
MSKQSAKPPKLPKPIIPPPAGFPPAPPGVQVHLKSDEQNPLTFNPTTSRYLPPIGYDDVGKPVYHLIGEQFAPYNRANHARASYRAYADVKYAHLSAGKYPSWVWWAFGGGAALVAIALVVRKVPT